MYVNINNYNYLNNDDYFKLEIYNIYLLIFLIIFFSFKK
jgi:hypothetical protein